MLFIKYFIIFNILFSVVAIFLAILLYKEIKTISINRGTVKIVLANGYKAEEHQVETEDGYILKIIRIPPKIFSKRRKPVVLLHHGMFCSADTWVTAMNISLAFLLSNAGYDVWLGNARGNSYSRKHRHFTPMDRDFWDFSFHEIGTQDLPAMIDYILNLTNQSGLHYVSNSQGGTSFLVLLSETTEYESKIRTSHLMSPVAFMQNTRSPLIFLMEILKYESFLGILARNREFLPSSNFKNWLCNRICRPSSLFHFICNDIMTLAGGDWHLNQTLLPLFCQTHPAGISTNQLLHYGQLYSSGRFQKFDFGPSLNLKMYKQISPPSYNLSKVTHCFNLYYGPNDYASDSLDVQELGGNLACSRVIEVPQDNWNHYDFTWGDDAKDLLYDQIIDKMNRDEKNRLP